MIGCMHYKLGFLEKPTLLVVIDLVEVLDNCLVYTKQSLFWFPLNESTDSLMLNPGGTLQKQYGWLMSIPDHSVLKKKGNVFLLWKDSDTFPLYLAASLLEHALFVCHLDQMKL